MSSYKSNPPTKEELQKWNSDKAINPRTKRKIKEGGKVYRLLEKLYTKSTQYKKNYLNERKQKIDPLLKVSLKHKRYRFKFKYMWNPYTGDRLKKDPDGPLYFDPDTLIHYFYLNRLNHLWVQSDEGHYYGDAVGTGPEFQVKSRGHHPDWNLFRLPIPDEYLEHDHCQQSVTMGPILTTGELQEIYDLACKKKKNYRKLHKRKRPDLIKMKELWEQATDQRPLLNIPDEVLPFITNGELAHMRYNINKKAVTALRFF